MLDKDSRRVMVLRMLKTDIKNREVELMRALEADEILDLIQKTIKMRTQAWEMYHEEGRNDLAEIEAAEIAILKEYLPQPLDEDELLHVVQTEIALLNAQGMKDMGKVIAAVKEKYGLRIDGKQLSIVVKTELNR